MSKFWWLVFIDFPRIFPKISHRTVIVPLVLFGEHFISSRPPSGTVYCQVTFAEKYSQNLALRMFNAHKISAWVN
jgi:hypothetical protein